MGSITEVTPAWEQWIVTNIERGVPVPSLIEEMVRKNFDIVAATSAVMRLAPSSVLAANSVLAKSTIAVPAYKFPIPVGYEQHYDNYRYQQERIAPENSIDIDGHCVRVLARVSEPDIVVFENILSAQECDQLIALSRPKLQRSTIVENQTGVEKVIDERSSEGTFFLREENVFLRMIEQRLSRLMQLPLENGEGIQILRYAIGAEYKPHYDFFPPENIGSAVHIKKGGQRVATLIIYLSDAESGGETIFPEIDFAVAPRKGGGVYFSYCD
ncbi:MAG TPA: 2OG-Fe(II) oxygenase, partial [Spongiibacteraceae bacterium]